MKVRDLKALMVRLEAVHADPDAILVFSPDEQYVMLVRPHRGMHQPFDEPELELTEDDREFLRALRIPH